MTTRLTKPLRRQVAWRPTMHGLKPLLVVTLYPGGIVSLREPRCRRTVELDLGKLYVQQLLELVRPPARRARVLTKCRRGSR